ncbi:MAG: hypothetical protein J5I93_24910 [Pirellulaceae bacterium]|nr:hypothetical protein [Pirellulaceae bacterium]
MTFSLTYAFGAMGRHTRKISREARAFVGGQFRKLEPSGLRDYLFAQYFAIDGTLFSVFYNDDRNDRLYPVHKKYANKLLDATESDFRHLARAYAFSLLANQPFSSGNEEEMVGRVNILRLIAFIYDGSNPTATWTSLVLQPDELIIAAALCQEIAHVLQLDPRDKGAFSSEWLSLVPTIIAGTEALVTHDDFRNSTAAMIESVDFGGTQR